MRVHYSEPDSTSESAIKGSSGRLLREACITRAVRTANAGYSKSRIDNAPFTRLFRMANTSIDSPKEIDARYVEMKIVIVTAVSGIAGRWYGFSVPIKARTISSEVKATEPKKAFTIISASEFIRCLQMSTNYALNIFSLFLC